MKLKPATESMNTYFVNSFPSGHRVVALGGGTDLSTLLRGLNIAFGIHLASSTILSIPRLRSSPT